MYYALVQELPCHRMGIWSGALAANGWIISSVFNMYVGGHIQRTKSYEIGLVVAGLAPALGLMMLLLLWRRGRG